MTIRRQRNRGRTGGFTVVEVVVAIVVMAIFIAVIFRLFILQIQVGTGWLQYENAEQLAYNNLKKYSRYAAAQTDSCDDYPTSSTQKTLLSSSTPVDGLPSPVVQSVISQMPYGCSDDLLTDGYPVQIISTVTYGPNAKKITHATYVGTGG